MLWKFGGIFSLNWIFNGSLMEIYTILLNGKALPTTHSLKYYGKSPHLLLHVGKF
jgi:hypothetical protein